jgi:putative transposase
LPRQKKLIKKAIAIDPNHKNLGYGVDTEGEAIEIKNPSFLKYLEKRIDQIKGNRARCQRRSKKIETSSGKNIYLQSRRYQRYDKAFKHAMRTRRERTKSYLYCIANKVFESYDLVSICDYTPTGGGINRGMRRSMNNFSLIGRFKETASWVAQRGGKTFHIWKEQGSTKTAPFAGDKGKALRQISESGTVTTAVVII